jgi:hypothetical protein
MKSKSNDDATFIATIHDKTINMIFLSDLAPEENVLTLEFSTDHIRIMK